MLQFGDNHMESAWISTVFVRLRPYLSHLTSTENLHRVVDCPCLKSASPVPQRIE